MPRRSMLVLLLLALPLPACATIKESDTARTGVEQMLISNAVDQALDKIDYSPLAGRKVLINSTYLDCVDKNYILVSLHQRLLAENVVMVEKPEEADAVLEVASGAVGTDRQQFFVGVPELPIPSLAIMIPKLSLYQRNKAMGTAKLRVIAFDAKTKERLVDSGIALARADYRNWAIMGAGPSAVGTIPQEIVEHTGQSEGMLDVPAPEEAWVNSRQRDTSDSMATRPDDLGEVEDDGVVR